MFFSTLSIAFLEYMFLVHILLKSVKKCPNKSPLPLIVSLGHTKNRLISWLIYIRIMLTLLQLQQSPLHETCPTQSGSHVTLTCGPHSKYKKIIITFRNTFQICSFKEPWFRNVVFPEWAKSFLEPSRIGFKYVFGDQFVFCSSLCYY